VAPYRKPAPPDSSYDGRKTSADARRCRNCGTALRGAFCSHCGQQDRDLRRPFWTLLGDFLNVVLALDSRVARTLTALIAAPGKISRRYVDGRRARYVPPVRLVVISVLVFFLALEITDVALVSVQTTGTGTQEGAQPDNRQAGSAANGPASEAGPDDETRARRREPGRPGALSLAFFVPLEETPRRSLIGEQDFAALQREMTKDPQSRVILGPMRSMLRGFNQIAQHPGLVNRVFNTWLPRAMLILVPVFAFLLRGMYWRRDAYFFDHLIFALHFHAFLFLFVTLLVFLSNVGLTSVSGWLYLAVIPAYFLLAIKRFYRQGWLRTLVKFLTVSFLYNLLLIVSLLAILIYGFAGP